MHIAGEHHSIPDGRVHEAVNDPVTDFPEAGHRVRKRLEQDRPVILVESFCEHYHIQLALNPVIHLRANVDLFVVCLHCELDTAIARKHPELPRDVIEREYARFSSRAKVPGEIVVATDHRPATHIAKHLFSLWTPAESTGV